MFEDELGPDPIAQFDAWYREAGTDAVCLVTASKDADPAGRMVLLKGHGEQGFDFYTNFDSAKGRHLTENPRAALVFHWLPHRQVRVTGTVTRIADAEANANQAVLHLRPPLPRRDVEIRTRSHASLASSRIVLRLLRRGPAGPPQPVLALGGEVVLIRLEAVGDAAPTR